MIEVSEASQIVNELLDTPLTMRQLAALVPCSTGAICMYANGQRGKFPSHRIMSRLLLLHRKLCKNGGLHEKEQHDTKNRSDLGQH